jgi:hypothetical protein
MPDEVIIFKCVWCNCLSTDNKYGCCAPDGDGHLFRREMSSTDTKVCNTLERRNPMETTKSFLTVLGKSLKDKEKGKVIDKERMKLIKAGAKAAKDEISALVKGLEA